MRNTGLSQEAFDLSSARRRTGDAGGLQERSTRQQRCRDLADPAHRQQS
jgi:hypothetical protein